MDLLAGVRVLSFNHYLAGPIGAQILGDLGADVIAIEPPGGAFQRKWAVANRFVGKDSVNHLATDRNKRSMVIDLKTPEGVALVRRMVRDTDVVMENFRPGTMDRLGLGYETLKEINPKLIYAVSSGFGTTGPWKDRAGQDLLLQALSGLAARTGSAEGGPTAVGTVCVDQHAATIYAMSILAALYARTQTGKGRLVEVSLYQAAIDMQIESLTAFLNGAQCDSPRGKAGIASWFSPGPYGIHPTKDGWIAISMAAPSALAKGLDAPELSDFGDDESFSKREEITTLVRNRLRQRTTEEWLPKLTAAKVWHAPVHDYPDLPEDPQLRHLGTFETREGTGGEKVTMVMHPARYDGEAPEVRLMPQPLGAQTREVLAEFGYAEKDIEELLRKGVVAAS